MSNIFLELRDAVRSGTAEAKFPVGTEIPDKWLDLANGNVYEMPFLVIDYRPRITANGDERLGVTLVRKHTLPREQVFNALDNADYLDSGISHYLDEEYALGCSEDLVNAIEPHLIVVGDECRECISTKHFLLSEPELRSHKQFERLQYFIGRDHTWEPASLIEAGNKPQYLWLRARAEYGPYCLVYSQGSIYTTRSFYDAAVLVACIIS